ncbi:MAG: type II secretion system protein [Patescibacteria group bacterium]|nr:type II secretion system GspH family protein [Patescibacteria group bacterium]MDE1945311.1 type II secretion system protein [Patescibacteria group bacterium]MDE2057579.1 type II secretion system protein [Patescibacteria group bacterium]
MRTSGFTLLETLVAVTILTLAVAGPLYVADRAAVAAQVSSQQLTASYLAQEGIEYARSMRDREFLYAYAAGGSNVSQDAWNAFVRGSGGSGEGSIASCEGQPCTYDGTPGLPMGVGSGRALAACANANMSSCGPLYLVNGYYAESGASNQVTPFTRAIQATLLSANDLKVTTTVFWVNRGTHYAVMVTDNLTPWQ